MAVTLLSLNNHWITNKRGDEKKKAREEDRSRSTGKTKLGIERRKLARQMDKWSGMRGDEKRKGKAWRNKFRFLVRTHFFGCSVTQSAEACRMSEREPVCAQEVLSDSPQVQPHYGTGTFLTTVACVQVSEFHCCWPRMLSYILQSRLTTHHTPGKIWQYSETVRSYLWIKSAYDPED
jgi:hypothetical protein